MFPEWLNILAIVWLSLAVITAVILYIDIKFNRPQPMKIMTIAWPVNALYFSIISLIFYFWFGRAPKQDNGKMPAMEMSSKGKSSMKMDDMPEMKGMHDMHDMKGMNGMKNMAHSMPGMSGMGDMAGMNMTPVKGQKLTWKGLFKTGTHCGSGCTLADIVGEVLVLYVPVAVFGSMVFGSWALDFALALIFGIFFQYLPEREMGMPKLKAFKKAIQADTLSVICWQIGMYIWMGLVFFYFFSPDMDRTSAVYWFMMQIAMIFGYFTAMPMNALLIKKGIKHLM